MARAADMATSSTPGMISFADIERDLEKTAYGCTNNAGGCHGGTMPTGIMQLTPNATQDMTTLMNNYQQIMARVSTATPDQSKLLQKTLATSTTSHGGIKPFTTDQDPTYQRWLLWIALGANFQAVSTAGGGDM